MNLEMISQFYAGKKVLVIGHTGFKGTWLAHILRLAGARVFGLAQSPRTSQDICVTTGLLDMVQHNLCDVRKYESVRDVIRSTRPDIVFHLAAQPLVRVSYDLPIETISTNVMGTVNVLEAVREVGCVKSVVIITTDKVYENKEWVYGYREQDHLGGHDPYSGSKAAADILTQTYIQSYFSPAEHGKTHETLVAIARAGNVIGGGDWSRDRLVPDIMRSVFYGDGLICLRNPGAVRPWEHVLEPLSGYLQLGVKLAEGRIEFSEAWNFGPDHSAWVPVGEVAQYVLYYLKKRFQREGSVRIEPDSSKHEAGLLMLDVTKAHRILGWRSRWSVNQALQETADWYACLAEKPQQILACTEAQIKHYFGGVT